MPIVSKTIVDVIEINADTGLQVRLASYFADGDTRVSEKQYHRFVLAGSGEVEATLAAVSAHLAALGRAAVSDGDLARVRRLAASELAGV